MNEFELKFEIPSARLRSVSIAVLKGKVTRQHLQAMYFDTADGALAKRSIVVRLRKEGRRWVQTAKGPTSNLLERLEHNVTLASQPARTVPVLDLVRHRGTPIGQAICAALGVKDDSSFPDLDVLYSTDVQRTTRQIAINGSTVELALDQGRVFAKGRSQTICELEVELKDGSPAHAVALGRQWCATHGLWLSTIAKSMKGQRLYRAEPYGIAVSAVAPQFSRTASGEEMTTAVVQSCLIQLMANASELASGSKRPDHIHQLRVAIRRLRTALRSLGDLSDAIDPEWETVLVQAFRVMGRHRDHSQLERVLLAQLLVAGGPEMHLTKLDASIPDPGETVRALDFQKVLLGLLEFVHRKRHDGLQKKSVARATLKKTLAVRLEKLHSHAVRDGKKFLSLDEEHQHGVRKRLKSLRYMIEFSAPLFADQEVNRMTDALKPAQDALGLYNDELVALHTLHTLAVEDPRAWFGIGWFTARRLPNAKLCLKEIKALIKVKRFWA